MTAVYVSMTLDVLHHGHANLLQEARRHGDIIVGLLTDSAVAERKRIPYLSYGQREAVARSLAGVTMVIPQNEWDDSVNIATLRPDVVVHGDDWCLGRDQEIRDKVIRALDEYGGRLIEISYTPGVSSGALAASQLSVGTTPEIRRGLLRRLLTAKQMVRLIETHSPMSALIAERSSFDRNGIVEEFDGFWSSSLTDSTHLGKPDIEVVSISERLQMINSIFEVTTKPLVIDGDTGGHPEHFALAVRSMERLGVSATIIEDKTGLKRNSLFGTSVQQTQEDVAAFSEKIAAGVAHRQSRDFMIFARIESLILERGMSDALERATAYAEAGADGLMIHSKSSNPSEVFEFATAFRRRDGNTPLVCVPTTYSGTTEAEIRDAGFNVVIYANHLLRAAYPAMKATALSILENQRALEAEKTIMSIDEILTIVPNP